MTFPSLWSSEVESKIRKEACSWDEQVTPKEVKFCKKCVVSNQRPRIVFDVDGVCSACRFAEHKKNGIDWDARKAELGKLLDRYRRQKGYAGYDVIVPCSGGKDSATVAHRLKHEYGMKPLCVKWAPFIYTDIGRCNFDAFVQSGFDVITAFPNGKIHRKLARLAFEYLGDPFHPFVYGQLCFPMHMAVRHNVRLVFFGENGEAEYGGDPAANDKPCWGNDEWNRVYLKGAGIQDLLAIGVGIGALTEDESKEASQFYGLPGIERSVDAQFHWLGYYLPWHPQANFYYASDNTGFTPNPGGRSEGTYSKYASLDDKMDGLHYWMAYMKFGIGRCTSDAAHEIRDGEINRGEGVALVKRYDGEFPERHFDECLDYLGLDEQQFHRIAARYRPPHIWMDGKDGNPGFVLRHTVFD